jgi:hypothetical protein
VDEVAQWQMVGCVEAITQSHLKPVLQDPLSRFPFSIRGFHSDNGSKFINDTVDGSLRDLLIGRPNRGRARAPTTGWGNVKTERSFANTWAMATSRRSMPKTSMSSFEHTSIRI